MKNFRDEYTEHGSSVAPSIALLNGVSHSHVNGVVLGNGNYIGGIIGCIVFVNRSGEKVISNSTFQGLVKGKNFVGGIVGADSAYKDSKPTYISNYQEVQNPLIVTIANNISKGSVQGVNFVGGIVGKSVPAGNYLDYVKFQIFRCQHFDGNVIGDSNFVGGIAGSSTGLISYSSHSNGYVEGSSEVGGIAGYTDSIIESYVVGSVVTRDSVVGGLAGRTSFVKNSYVVASSIRKMNEMAMVTIIKTVVDAYYDAQQFEWHKNENKALVQKAENWVASYLKRYAALYCKAESKQIAGMAKSARDNALAKGTFLIESETLNQYLKRIVDTAKPIPRWEQNV